MTTIRVIPKSVYPFDVDLALTETRNAEKLFTLHLNRCDDPGAAQTMMEVFERLAGKFRQKTLALKANL